MRLGINLMAWSATVGPAERALFPVLAALGYEGVELPLFHPAAFDPAPVREALQASGLECTLACALPEGASLLVPDAQPAALAFLRQCLGVARALGASVLCGPLYAPVGVRTGAPPTAAEWRAAVEGLRVVAALAAVGYRGWLVCETFNGQIPEIAAATAIWRPLFPDPLTYARESLAFLRRLLPTVGGAR